MVKRCQSFPIRSWIDLPHVCNSSPCMAFHFRDCQNCFCLLITLSTLRSPISLIPGTFHPKRWSLRSPCCPASKHFRLNSNPLNLALAGKAVLIERLEQTGHLPKLMADNYEWIAKAFAGKSVHSQGREHVIENLFHQVPVCPRVSRTRCRTVKTDHWAIAVNAQSEDVKNLTFAVSSAAGATLWGQWSRSALISRRGSVLGKYTGMDYMRSAASCCYYVVFRGRCTISSIQSGC
jgi:hypothetical protein